MDLNGKSVCVVMMSALGDCVHVLPVLNAIRRAAPAATLSWILEGAGARLMTGHPAVDEIIIHGRGLRALSLLRRKMRDRRFDLVLDLQVAMKAGLTTAVLPARRKIGFDMARARDANWLFTNERIPPHEPQHVQDQYFEFLDWLGIAAEPLVWNLGPWPGEEQLVEPMLASTDRPIVPLVLATSRAEKDWFADRWAELGSVLYHDFGLQPVLAGGASEKERAIEATIRSAANFPVVSALGSTLRELVALLSHSALVVSPDTAPLHMSVALDVPVIGLMGYTNPRRVGPYRRFHDLLVDAYGNPGEVYGPSLEYRAGRMERISVADVIDKVGVWSRTYGGNKGDAKGR